MWRHNPGLNAAIEAARRGWLGEVFLIRATINNTLDPRRRHEWEQFPGGVLFELGSHLVDALVRLMGRPERVTPFLKTHGSRTDSLADNNVTVFEYPSASAVITSSTLQFNAFAHRAFEIMGTKGTAVVRPMEPPELHLDLAEAAGPYARGRQTVPQPEYRRYAGEFEELARCLRENRPLPVSLEQERDVQETLLRACGAV
jgi:predicted dehydrogenase